jgi:hypothetical protein
MQRWYFFTQKNRSLTCWRSYRIAWHFLKLPLAACEGVSALAQETQSVTKQQ